MKNTKRIAAIGLAAMLSGCMLGNTDTLGALSESSAITANAATASGTCGAGLNWSLSGDTLTITGTGTTMKNYARYSNMAPWRTYASQIKKVYFPKTLKSIGSYAFYNMTALEYVYTKDGYNKPCLPDLTTIGDYAFAECYAFYGCTSNGVLTLGLGTSSVMKNGTVTVKDSAFMNCDRVRFLKCNYKTMIVEEWGFARMDALTTVSMSNTKVQLGKSAFNGCSNLATVNVLPSVLPIHNSAFNYTKYLSNNCTNADYYLRNTGAAKKLKGKQLIVNIFVDRAIVNDNSTDFIDGYIRTVNSNEYYKQNNGEIITRRRDGTKRPLYVYKKSDMTARYAYGWNAKKGNRTDDSAITLNKLDYTSKSDNNHIKLSDIQNATNDGFFGSYVNSSDISTRLRAVRDALNNFQAQAAEYGASFTYEMYPETNFQITYDSFNWDSNPAYATDQNGAYLGYNETIGYKEGGASIGGHSGSPEFNTGIAGKNDNKLFVALKNMSSQLNAQAIDLSKNSNNEFSEYTRFLKNEYHVDGVVYYIHINNPLSTCVSYASRRTENMDEFAVICYKENSYSDLVRAIMHETSHLYGANDYYYEAKVKRESQDFADDYLGGDVMLGMSKGISPVTAFSIGWLDRLDKTVWNIFFG